MGCHSIKMGFTSKKKHGNNNNNVKCDAADDDDDVVEDDDCPAPPLLRPPLRLSFDRKAEFAEKEEIHFPPLANAGRWIDSSGGMSFVFMVRPLTWQQKCENLEAYLAKID